MNIDLSGDEMGVLIGKRGQTLDSLQYLVSLIVNKESTDYIRVKVDKAIDMADDASEPNLDLITISFNEADWTLKDGWYYYNGTIKAGEKTEMLFDTVTFSKDMGNEYQNATATINITAQAVQVAHNGDSALTAEGWA